VNNRQNTLLGGNAGVVQASGNGAGAPAEGSTNIFSREETEESEEGISRGGTGTH